VRQIVARCPKCKSTHLIALSSRMTANGRIRRVQCLEDGCNLVFAVLLV
jgi:transcriptional regulator NrdR family protein